MLALLNIITFGILPALGFSAVPNFRSGCPQPSPAYAVPTLPGEFPYMCAIGWKSKTNESLYEFKCGGALLSNQFVLTAAHCFFGSDDLPVIVNIGGMNLTDTSDGYDIIEIIMHPDYEYPSSYNDVALIRLNTKRTQFAYLMIKDPFLNETLTAVGYGDTRFGGSPTKQLLKIFVNTVSNEECRNYYEPDELNSFLRNGIEETQLCAVDPEKLMNTCQGDSGGPLVRRHLGIHYVMGITSFGVGCENGPPGVYTRVSKYVPWIESTMRPWYNEEYPYMFAFRWINHITCELEEKLCGAVLIRWNFLLLAAHCFHELDEIPRIYQHGGYNIHYTDTVGVYGYHEHPEYEYPHPYNDIGLIEISFTAYAITPIWLKNRLENQTVTAVNYAGTTRANFIAQNLLKTTLYVIPNDECSKLYSRNLYSANFTRGIVDSHICAQDTEKRWDLKQGYSEGPLIMHVNQPNVSIPYVVGLSSYGENCFNCPPGVFTRVSEYLDWLLPTMANNSQIFSY